MVCAFVAVGAVAAETQNGGVREFRAYVELDTRGDRLGESVRNRVIYFVNYGCRHCRLAHTYLPAWGQSLPEPLRFEVVPAVALREHLPMAVAYYAVLVTAPERLHDFERELYRLLAEIGRSAWDGDTYRVAAERVGIDRDAFIASTQSDEVALYVRRAHELTMLFELDEVPTVVIAGRFKTTPGVVQNGQTMFTRLINGLVSAVYEELVR